MHAGVDFVVATDNRSDDGTTEILERHERAGVLHLVHEPADDMRQDEWVTRMARLAATEFEADWVIESDADEFWWPRGGSLKDVLATVPERFGLVRGCWRHFVPLPEDGAPFSERMIVRLAAPHRPMTRGRSSTRIRRWRRAVADVEIEFGNHDARTRPRAPSRLAPDRGVSTSRSAARHNCGGRRKGVTCATRAISR